MTSLQRLREKNGFNEWDVSGRDKVPDGREDFLRFFLFLFL